MQNHQLHMCVCVCVCVAETQGIYMQEYCIKMYPDYHNSKIILKTSKIET